MLANMTACDLFAYLPLLCLLDLFSQTALSMTSIQSFINQLAQTCRSSSSPHPWPRESHRAQTLHLRGLTLLFILTVHVSPPQALDQLVTVSKDNRISKPFYTL